MNVSLSRIYRTSAEVLRGRGAILGTRNNEKVCPALGKSLIRLRRSLRAVEEAQTQEQAVAARYGRFYSSVCD